MAHKLIGAAAVAFAMLAALLATMLTTGQALAGRIDPALEARLREAGSSDNVRVIVEMKEQARAAELVRALPKGARKAKLKALVAGLKDKARRDQAALLKELERERTLGTVQRMRPLWVLNGLALAARPQLIRKLAARDDVLEVRLDQVIPPPPRPAAAGESSGPNEWNIAQIRAPEVWALDPAYNGQGAVVGSFDSGVDLWHPDLVDRYRGDHSISWFDPYGEHSFPVDPNGHGTHTIATAVGGNAGGTHVGVAPGAKWIAAKAWDDAGNGYASAFHEIFEWFLAPGGDPDNAPDVVNNSWAFVLGGCNAEFTADIQAWRAAEIFPAFAAGNSGPNAGTVRSPGAYADAFAVGATDVVDEVASFSSRGPSPCTGLVKPDVSAPGAAVRSAVPGGDYGTMSGTSMATPHVAGAVAVMRSINRAMNVAEMTVEELATALVSSATDIAQPGADQDSGAGRLDLLLAAEITIRGPTVPIVKVAATVPSVAEAGGGSGMLTFTRTGNTDAPLEVMLSVSGTASPGVDYIALPASVSIPAGATSATLAVTALDDTLVEANEMVIVTIASDPAYIQAWSRVASVIIVSDELFPDLAVSTITGPASAAAGQTIGVSETTRNQGAGAAPASVTHLYVSADGGLDASDRLLATRAVPALAPGAASSASTAVTLPSDIVSGAYYLIGKADGPDAVPESAEGNNVGLRSILVGADLTLSSLVAPSVAGEGQSLTATDITTNAGSGTAAASTTRYYLSANSLLDATDAAIGSRAVPPLAAGESSSGPATLTIPAGIAAGAWYLIAKADADETVPEAGESNNSALRMLQIGSDLSIAALSGPALVAAGQSVSISETTQNQGGATAPDSTTRYYLSADSGVDASDLPLGSRAVPALAAGASSAASVSLVIPAQAAAGSWNLIAKADADNVLGESSELNNVRTWSIQLGPDLFVYSLSAPATTSAGLSIAVNETTRNQGGAAAGDSITRFYLSADSTIDANDALLGSRDVPALASGSNSSAAITLTIPAGTQAGGWFLIARSDATDAIAETTEVNNAKWSWIQIGPDLTVQAFSVPSAAAAGQSVAVSDTTANIGGGAAPASATRYFLSADAMLDAGDSLLGSRSVPALAAGASSAGSASLTLPADLATGTWYLFARVDATDAVAESAENNNVGNASIRVGVDLVVSAFSAPAAAGPGDSITLTDTTRQQGGGSVPASITRFLLSADGTADAGDTLLGTRSVPALTSGASSTASSVVTIPPGTPVGLWYLIAKADGDGNIAEVSESNNTATWSLQLGADLVISSLTAPVIGGAGQAITLTDTTRNQGGAAPASVTQYFLSANSSFDAADTALGTRSVPQLGSGASSTGSVTLNLPAGVTTGTWYIIARADAGDVVTETSEANNTYWRSMQVGPDLSVWALNVPATAGPSQTITVSDTISNGGGGSATASAVQYFLSSDAALDAADVAIGTRNAPVIAAGASNTGSVSLTLPATVTTGTWYILARADANNVVAELNESNNVGARGFQVGPDLIVYSLTAPATAGAGRTLTISDSVRNQGGATAPGSTTRYFLSSNATLDASDVSIGSAGVPALAAGATSSASITLTIPADTVTGAWYLIAQADGAGEVGETSETNNIGSRTLQVGVDLVLSGVSAPAGAAAGQTILVSDTTRNQGAGLAPASSTQYFLSANSTLDANDTLLGARAVPALDTGASSAASTAITLPASLATGVWYLIAKADGAGGVPETSETNNTSYWPLQVGSDLIVYSAVVPGSAVAGQSIVISDTIRNLGAANAEASVTQFYLSRDTVIDAGDRLLGVRNVPAIAAGALQSGTSTFTLPADTAASGWYLLVKADGEGSVAESSETNNVVWRWFQVSAAP